MSSPTGFPEDETVIESQGVVLGGSKVHNKLDVSNATETNALVGSLGSVVAHYDMDKEKKEEVVIASPDTPVFVSGALEGQVTLAHEAAVASSNYERMEHTEALPVDFSEYRDHHCEKQNVDSEKHEDTGGIYTDALFNCDSATSAKTQVEKPKTSEEEKLFIESENVNDDNVAKSCRPVEVAEHATTQEGSHNSEGKDTNVNVAVEMESTSERTVSSDSKSTAVERSQVGEGTSPLKEENALTDKNGDAAAPNSSPRLKVIGKNEKLERKMALLAKLNEVESRKLKYMEKKITPSSSPIEKPSNTDRMSPPTLDIQAASLGEYSESRAASSPQDSERDKSSRSLRPRTPGSQRNTAKLIMSPHTPGSDYKEDPLYFKCKNVLKSLMERKDARAFLKPIDELFTSEEIPGYFQIVKHPMDLGTVLYRMELGLYRHPTVEELPKYPQFDLERFKADVRLVWENAMTYNLQGTPYHTTAAKLSETFERKLEATLRSLPETKLFKSKEKKRQSVSRPVQERPVKKQNVSSMKRKTPPEANSNKLSHHSFTKVKPTASTSAATTTVSTDKKNRNNHRTYSSFAAASHASMTAESPSSSIQKLQEKIRELERMQARMASSSIEYQSQDISSSPSPLVNVPMTYEEKRKLGDNINLLPGDKLAKVVQIIMRHKGSTPVNDREEIEIDIDALDTRTLREMEAFVQSALQKRVQKKKGSSLGETFTTQTSSVTSELENLREQLRNLQGTNYDMGMTLESGQTVSATSGGGGLIGGDDDKGFSSTAHAEESGNNELSTVPESSNRDSTELKQQQQPSEEQMYSSDDSDSTSDTASVSDN
ncbi:Transcription factor GTE2 [Galdieria sulphuraria]|uniref:Bromodomain-containing protein 3 n=1 Tax=Galdieria sulphuraria TaxID=130081 RepID=M2X3T4_GALSU|nr:bromodomain-containing protein 3 [Galdieria sulphuraria]EME31085.1 bromodomain-containing protein 3 [Galdieria sulphuraria]GJD12446.1 Transcription factor GTE2 [Galdieria sulphuraria]|eukprot:XP_005707605.1 bromodomain-containing protein 3 [Galdieria sulphuraria]